MDRNSTLDRALEHPRARWVVPLLLAVAAVAAFAPSLAGGFVYDDHRFVERNEAIRSLGNTLDFLVDPRTVAPDTWEGIYRPLRTLSFAIDRAVWGGGPAGYHVQSFLWHVLAVLFLHALLGRLGVRRDSAAAIALLYAVHPVHAESVAWITSRSDVMSGALVFMTLFVYARAGQPSARRMAGVTALAFAAMMAKEAAVVLAPLIVILDLVVLRRPGPGDAGDGSVTLLARLRRHGLRCWVPVAVAVVVYISLRQWRTLAYSPSGQFGHLTTWWGGSYTAQLAVAARGFLLSVLSVFWPLGFRLDFYPVTDGRVDAPVILAVVLLLVALLAATVSWRRRPLATVGVLWFLVAMFPTSNVLFTVGIPSADRFMYVPIVGAFLVLVPVLRGRRIWIAVVAALLLVPISWKTSVAFRDEDTLWSRAPADSPRRLVHLARRAYDRTLVRWDAGERDEDRLELPEAIEASLTAIENFTSILGTSAMAPLDLTFVQVANLERLRRDRRAAYANLKKAQYIRRNVAKTSFIMGLLYKDVGDYLGARREFLAAYEREFRDPINDEIARVLNEQAKLEVADGSYGRALALLIDSRTEWHEDEGNVGIDAEIERMEKMCRQVRNAPDPIGADADAWLRRGVELSQFGAWDDALGILARLRQQLPGSLPVAIAFARWGYEEAGDMKSAARQYWAALALDPENVAAREGLVRCGVFGADAALLSDPGRRYALLEGLESTPRVLVLRARALEDLGRADEARPLLLEAAEGTGPGVMDAIHDLWDADGRDV